MEKQDQVRPLDEMMLKVRTEGLEEASPTGLGGQRPRSWEFHIIFHFANFHFTDEEIEALFERMTLI